LRAENTLAFGKVRTAFRLYVSGAKNVIVPLELSIEIFFQEFSRSLCRSLDRVACFLIHEPPFGTNSVPNTFLTWRAIAKSFEIWYRLLELWNQSQLVPRLWSPNRAITPRLFGTIWNLFRIWLFGFTCHPSKPSRSPFYSTNMRPSGASDFS